MHGFKRLVILFFSLICSISILTACSNTFKGIEKDINTLGDGNTTTTKSTTVITSQPVISTTTTASDAEKLPITSVPPPPPQ